MQNIQSDTKKLKKSSKQKPLQPKFSLPLLPFIYCLIILIVLLIFYYYHLLAQRNFLWDDCLYQWYPLLTFAKECFMNFQLPVWNPYIYSGMPFLNDPSPLLLYPVNWLFLFLNGSAPLHFLQVELIPLFHLLLIGFFAFILFKHLKINWQISIYGSIVFIFSGYISLRIFQITPTIVFCWSILIFYFFIRILNEVNYAVVVLGGITLGIAILGGHPQLMLYLVYTLAIYYIGHMIFVQKHSLIKWLPSSLIRLGIFFLIGIGIAMVQYYPSIKYIPFTPRGVQTYAQTTDGSMLPIQLLTILIPKFFGSVTGGGTDSVGFWATRFGHYYWETAIYLGILPFFLALVGIFYSTRKTKYIFLVIAGLALLFALGKYFPFYKIFWYIIPGLKRFRFPARLSSIYTLSMGVLVVFGLEYVLTATEKLKQNLLKFTRGVEFFLLFSIFVYILFTTGALKSLSQYFNQPDIWSNCLKQFRIFLLFLFLTWLFFISRRRLKASMTFFVIFAGIISFIDLYQFGHKFSKGENSPTDFYPNSRMVNFLQQEREKEIFRIKTREGGYMLLKRNESILWKLDALEGYTSLPLERYLSFDIPTSRKNELLNTKYLINIDTIQNRLGIIENSKYLPRVFFCYDYHVVKGDTAILSLLASDTFDVSQVVILEETPSEQLSDQKGNTSVNIQHLRNDYINVSVKTDQPGFLVLSEVYYPEWKACIDGKSTKIYRADYTLRAVYVPAGEHKIEMYYSKRNITIGGLIALITLIFSVIIGLVSFQRTRRKKIII